VAEGERALDVHPLQSLAHHLSPIMPSTARAPTWTGRLARLAAKLAVTALGVVLALLLGIRVVVYPQLEARHADVARWLGARIGQPVEIDEIVTGWDGWNPKLSIRGFRLRDRVHDNVVLDLPRVDLRVAWTSIPRLDLRLSELEIDAPRLAVRRDARGRLHVGGFEWRTEETSDDSPFAEWLLRQPNVVVRDALVSWDDELRHAPQLLLDRVQFRLVQRAGRHQAGLTGVPPAELAAPIDIRADLTGASLKEPGSLQGRFYVRLDYADVAAWREWLPLPFALDSGRGALRLWVDVAQGQARAGTADLELADVQAVLGGDLAPISVAHLAGRVQWRQSETARTFSASDLVLALPDGSGVGSTNVTLALREPRGSDPGGGTLSFSALDLAPLATLAAHLPLPDTARADITRLAPSGSLRNGHIEWTGEARAPIRYAIAADVHALSVASHDGALGVASLSGRLAMNEAGGDIDVEAADASVTLPHLFAEPLALGRVRGAVSWQRDDGQTSVAWRDLTFDGPSVAGATSGAWHPRAAAPGTIDLQVKLTHAPLADAHRYVPIVTAPSLREWLRRAISGGTTRDATLVLEGDLAQFPFRDGKGGRFALQVKASDVALTYADGWPAIKGIAGDVRIDGAHVSIDATRGSIGDAALGPTHAEMMDFHDAQLVVDGRASGPTRAFLDFIAASPVAEWTAHATDATRVTGDGELALHLALPLHDLAHASVGGRYRFAQNAIEPSGAPALAALSGELAFTGHDVSASGITAQALGGPLTLALSASGARVHVDASGRAEIAQVRQAFDAPFLSRIDGTTDWKLALDAVDHDVAWSVESSLVGARVDLPAPFRKAATDAVPLRVERKPLATAEARSAGERKASKAVEDRVTIDYGRIARAVLRRRVVDSSPAIDRAVVLVGKSIADNVDASQSGVFVRANVPEANVDDWLDFASGAQPSASGSSDVPAVRGIDLQAAKVTVLGRSFTDVKATARRTPADWRVALDGPELAGSANWRAPSRDEPDGRLVAHLTRLVSTPAPDASASAEATRPESNASHWPAVDLVADDLLRKGRSLGRLEVRAQPVGGAWQIRKLVLSNEAGAIEAHGAWHVAASPPRTELDIAIDVKEAGAFLGRFGWPYAVKGAATKIDGRVAWAGSPGDFDYPSLGGRLALRAGAGQFTRLEPGVGRLLGVLSLQALPRRISLDFRDVFSEGFAFDTIAGNIVIDHGIMHTDDLRLAGPAAAVDLSGDVDLARETQQLQVRVKPSLSTGVSAGAAALFIANPLLGAAVGAGTLLAQKMLNNPFDQLFSYRYAVTGTFDDPVVARIGATATSADSSASR
jgi:uncharacterized protein (TIGR02099 family)